MTSVTKNKDVPIYLLDDNRDFKTVKDAFEYIFPEYNDLYDIPNYM